MSQGACPHLQSPLMSQLQGRLRPALGGGHQSGFKLCPSLGTKKMVAMGPQDTGLSPQTLQDPPAGQVHEGHARLSLSPPPRPCGPTFWTLTGIEVPGEHQAACLTCTSTSPVASAHPAGAPAPHPHLCGRSVSLWQPQDFQPCSARSCPPAESSFHLVHSPLPPFLPPQLRAPGGQDGPAHPRVPWRVRQGGETASGHVMKGPGQVASWA